MKKYSIGIDFGTLSGRAVLVDLQTGDIASEAVYAYPHGVMSEVFLDGTALPADFALQHPKDYIDVLENTIPEVLRKAGVSGESVVGLGIDFTSCTVLPVKKDGTPLCFLPQFSDNPHAYVKLWKHHAAAPYADKLTELAKGSTLLRRFGGKISSEFLFPKLAEVADRAPHLFDAADYFIEAGDYLVWRLTGNRVGCAGMAGFKGLWSSAEGYPENDLLCALHPRLNGVVKTKLTESIAFCGEKAGGITEEFARLTTLPVGTPVSCACIDAHAALPAAGIVDSDEMLLILGTSSVHLFMSDKEQFVDGICGVVDGGVLKGRYCYEAGQACVGDHFDWFVKNCLPASYEAEATERGVSVHQILTERASALQIGESGLLALDWWGGNRSVLVDVDLSGLLVGMTLQTKPEEIYRALIEGTAFGTKIILDRFEECGVPVGNLLAGGGIAEKNPLLMQIYADVTGREIRLCGSHQAGALGSAIFGAVAGGFFESVKDAAAIMARRSDTVYRPIPENVEAYQALYKEYKILHDYFGRGENDVMKRLKALKKSAKGEK